MAGGYKQLHKHANWNSNGFAKNPQNIAKGISKLPNIVAEVNKMSNEGFVRFSKNDIVEYDPKVGVTIKVPTIKAAALKIAKMQVSKNERLALEANRFIHEQTHGKPRQQLAIEQTITPEKLPISVRPTAICERCKKEIIE